MILLKRALNGSVSTIQKNIWCCWTDADIRKHTTGHQADDVETEIQVAGNHDGDRCRSDVDGLHGGWQEGESTTDGARQILGHPGIGCGQDQIQG